MFSFPALKIPFDSSSLVKCDTVWVWVLMAYDLQWLRLTIKIYELADNESINISLRLMRHEALEVNSVRDVICLLVLSQSTTPSR